MKVLDIKQCGAAANYCESRLQLLTNFILFIPSIRQIALCLVIVCGCVGGGVPAEASDSFTEIFRASKAAIIPKKSLRRQSEKPKSDHTLEPTGEKSTSPPTGKPRSNSSVKISDSALPLKLSIRSTSQSSLTSSTLTRKSSVESSVGRPDSPGGDDRKSIARKLSDKNLLKLASITGSTGRPDSPGRGGDQKSIVRKSSGKNLNLNDIANSSTGRANSPVGEGSDGKVVSKKLSNRSLLNQVSTTSHSGKTSYFTATPRTLARAQADFEESDEEDLNINPEEFFQDCELKYPSPPRFKKFIGKPRKRALEWCKEIKITDVGFKNTYDIHRRFSEDIWELFLTYGLLEKRIFDYDGKNLIASKDVVTLLQQEQYESEASEGSYESNLSYTSEENCESYESYEKVELWNYYRKVLEIARYLRHPKAVELKVLIEGKESSGASDKIIFSQPNLSSKLESLIASAYFLEQELIRAKSYYYYTRLYSLSKQWKE